MDLEAAVLAFLTHLETERRVSAHTLDAYRRDLATLVRFVAARREKLGRPPHLDDLDVYVLRGWLGELSRTLSASSVARKVAALRTFYRYLRRRGAVAKNVADELASPKVRRPLPTFLSAADLAHRIGRPVEAVELWLRRFRKSHPDCFTEVEGTRRNEPRVWYRTADVWKPLLAWAHRRKPG